MSRFVWPTSAGGEVPSNEMNSPSKMIVGKPMNEETNKNEEVHTNEKAVADEKLPTGNEESISDERLAGKKESASDSMKKNDVKNGNKKKPKKKAKKKGRVSISTIILVVIMMAGAGIFLYPSISDWWNSMHATQAIAGYVAAVEDMSAEEKEAMLEEATDYNESLANGVNFNLSDE
ncbi:MAG: hypothetical protein K1W22_03020, partial [Lachnospiraceae bacterium]